MPGPNRAIRNDCHEESKKRRPLGCSKILESSSLCGYLKGIGSIHHSQPRAKSALAAGLARRAAREWRAARKRLLEAAIFGSGFAALAAGWLILLRHTNLLGDELSQIAVQLANVPAAVRNQKAAGACAVPTADARKLGRRNYLGDAPAAGEIMLRTRISAFGRIIIIARRLVIERRSFTQSVIASGCTIAFGAEYVNWRLLRPLTDVWYVSVRWAC